MRLQLIRYESVELTEQLMRERQSDTNSVEDVPQTCHQSGEESEVRGPAQTDRTSTDSGSERECTKVGERTENGLLVCRSRTSSHDLREKSVMQQLQDTAQQLGMEVV